MSCTYHRVQYGTHLLWLLPVGLLQVVMLGVQVLAGVMLPSAVIFCSQRPPAEPEACKRWNRSKRLRL
jgi:hypothetical protein